MHAILFAAIITVACAEVAPVLDQVVNLIDTKATNEKKTTDTKIGLVETNTKAPVLALANKPGDAATFATLDAASKMSLISAFNDDMMSYYYLWISYSWIAKKVADAGGWMPKATWGAWTGAADQMYQHPFAANALEKTPPSWMQKPFGQFKMRMAKSFERGAEEETAAEEVADLVATASEEQEEVEQHIEQSLEKRVEHDIDSILHKLPTMGLSKEKKTKVLGNLKAMKTDLKQLATTSPKHAKELKKALSLRVAALKKQMGSKEGAEQAEEASPEEQDEEASPDEESFLQLAVTKRKGMEAAGMPKANILTVWCRWLDLAANWHITANTYMGLSEDYKALAADMKAQKAQYTTFLSLWTNTAKLHWQYSAIYTDYLTILNEYKPLPYLPYVSAYSLRAFDGFVMMWMTSSYVKLYTAVTTPMNTAKAALNFACAVNGLEASRTLKQIILIQYLEEFKVPAAKVFIGVLPVLLAEFAIKMLWNSATTRASIFLAK